MNILSVITRDILKKVYHKRKVDSHKYQFGSLLVVGGSRVYHGSPIFNAMGAYRSGVDLVTVAAPERSANLIGAYSPDIITHPLKGDFINENHVKEIIEISKSCDAMVIGGGIGKGEQTKKAVRKILSSFKKPVVVDADGIRAITPKDIKSNFVLKPHSDEFKYLSSKNATKSSVEKFAKENKCVVLLSASKDIISDGKITMENWTGNPNMTVGGTGDILSGICGSLLAQGINQMDAACAAAYINGRAGDLAAKTKRQALMASDVLNYIEKVIL